VVRCGTGGEPPPRQRRIEFGELNAGGFGRVTANYDQSSDDLAVLGITMELADNIDPELAGAFRRAAASFIDSAEDQDEQAAAKETVSALVTAVLQRTGNFADAVRRKSFRQLLTDPSNTNSTRRSVSLCRRARGGRRFVSGCPPHPKSR